MKEDGVFVGFSLVVRICTRGRVMMDDAESYVDG
jgi:hypothetical protein